MFKRKKTATSWYKKNKTINKTKEIKINLKDFKNIDRTIDDKLHFKFCVLDSYRKLFNFVICERDPGKTTALYLKLIKNWFYKKESFILIRRYSADINQDLARSMQNIVNKFLRYRVEINLKSSANGVNSIELFNPFTQKTEIIGIAVALNISVDRIKSAFAVKNVSVVAFDEITINVRRGERYVRGETEVIFDLIKTVDKLRDNTKKGSILRFYGLGNPYTRYVPIFKHLGVPIDKLESGKTLVGSNWVIQCYKTHPKLKAILAKNAIYDNKNTKWFTDYALKGDYSFDKDIEIIPEPPKSKLKWILFSEGSYYGIFEVRNKKYKKYSFFVRTLNKNNINKHRKIFYLSVYDAAYGNALVNKRNKSEFEAFEVAFSLGKREKTGLVAFNSVECYYKIIEFYEALSNIIGENKINANTTE